MIKEDLAINIANFKECAQREIQLYDAIEEALDTNVMQALPLVTMLDAEHKNLVSNLEKIKQIIELTLTYRLLVNEDDYNEVDYMLKVLPLKYVQETFLSFFDRRERIENKILELIGNECN